MCVGRWAGGIVEQHVECRSNDERWTGLGSSHRKRGADGSCLYVYTVTTAAGCFIGCAQRQNNAVIDQNNKDRPAGPALFPQKKGPRSITVDRMRRQNRRPGSFLHTHKHKHNININIKMLA